MAKSKKITGAALVAPVLPEKKLTGNVEINFQNRKVTVSAELAETLIKKGLATL